MVGTRSLHGSDIPRRDARHRPLHLAVLAGLLIALLVAVFMYLLFDARWQSWETSLRASEQNTVQIAQSGVVAELFGVMSDVRYLARQQGLQRWLEQQSDEALHDLTAEYRTFAQERGLYDQIRLIDSSGAERVRVNWTTSGPVAASESDLQDKVDRYYVREALALQPGDVFVSPFDLNVEHGAVEDPRKPVIRFATPVSDGAGNLRGLTVLNFRGDTLLDLIREQVAGSIGQVHLLNADGFWLLGPTPDDEWTFMYPDRPQRNFQALYSEAWNRLRDAAEGGQFMAGGDLITFAAVRPFDIQRSTADAATDRSWLPRPWILLSRVSSGEIGERRNDLLGDFLLAGAVLAVLLLVGLAIMLQQELKRRRAEVGMQVSEARFRALLDAAPDAIVIIDSDARIVLASDQTEQLFGYPRGELLGQPIEILLPERLRERHVRHRDAFVAQPRLRPMGAGLDLRGLRADGQEFPVEVSLSPVETDVGLRTIAAVRDVSEQFAAVKAIRDSEERFSLAAKGSSVGIWDRVSVDDDEEIWSDKFYELLGYKPKEIAATQANFLTLVHPEDREPMLKMLAGHLSGHNAFDIEYRLRHKHHGYRWFNGMAQASWDERGNPVRVVGTIQDIHQRRKADDLERSNQDLEQFAYVASHDLQEPLRMVAGFCDLLKKDYADKLDDRGREFIDFAVDGAKRMRLLIDDLLVYSRVGRVEGLPRAVNLNDVVEQAKDLLAQPIADSGAVIQCEELPMVTGDLGQLVQMMQNLLGNAIKFRGPEAPQVRISCERREHDYLIKVADNGIGMDPRFAERIFMMFQRLHNRDEYPGTGIGLAVCKKIVERHSGRIWLDTDVRDGATFAIALPHQDWSELPSDAVAGMEA